MLEVTRADQNTGGALLESPMRTDMHGKSRVLSAVSVELNLSAISVCHLPLFYYKQNFRQFSHLWRQPSGLGVGVVIIGRWKLKVRAHMEMLTKFFSAMILISVLGPVIIIYLTHYVFHKNM